MVPMGLSESVEIRHWTGMRGLIIPLFINSTQFFSADIQVYSMILDFNEVSCKIIINLDLDFWV